MLNPTCFVGNPDIYWMYYLIRKNINLQFLHPELEMRLSVSPCSSTWETLVRGAHLNSRPANQAEQRTRLEINGSTRLSLGTPLLLSLARSIWACSHFNLETLLFIFSILFCSFPLSERRPHSSTFKAQSWRMLCTEQIIHIKRKKIK